MNKREIDLENALNRLDMELSCIDLEGGTNDRTIAKEIIKAYGLRRAIEEAEWWAWHLTSVQMKTFGKDGIAPEQRIEQLKRGEL